jgi:hypothetical protein
MPVPPQEVCPFSSQQSFGCPTSFLGFNNRPDRKSQSHCSYEFSTFRKSIPNNSLTQREISHGLDNPPLQYPMGLTTHFFSPSPKLTSYTNKYGYGYRFRYMT